MKKDLFALRTKGKQTKTHPFVKDYGKSYRVTMATTDSTAADHLSVKISHGEKACGSEGKLSEPLYLKTDE